ncbi:peptidase M50-like protein [Sphingobacterium paludis]|uniref:Peptidase M50-like protein n=2 Tax=Sphingobacterium paludis TaxID=1476465 RepID=A0A4R7DAU5_9SPHI|nr:peptidase M50-like protein [Sphingobacterium paludis]
MLAYLVGSYLWFLYALALSVVCHEAGHYVAARLVGERPWQITLGTGAKIAVWRFFGAKLAIHATLFSGAVLTVYRRSTKRRTRRFITILGGPLFNLFFAINFLYHWPHSFLRKDGIEWLPIFGAANLVMGVVNLIPFKGKFMGIAIDSDGRQLLGIPFMKEEELSLNPLQDEWMKANDLIEEKKYDAALKIYDTYASNLDANKIQYINVAVLHIKQGRYSEAQSILQNLLHHINDPDVKVFETYVYHNLAYVYLLLDKLDEAQDMILKARALAGKFMAVESLHGYILVEQGRATEAIPLLAKHFREDLIGTDTLETAMYLAVAYADLDQLEKAKKLWRKIEQHTAVLDADEACLFRRLAPKIQDRILTPFLK